MNKLKLLGMIIVLVLLSTGFAEVSFAQGNTKGKMSSQMINTKNHKPITKYEFPPLDFAYDALEPYIDKLTVEIHYSKHFRMYYDNFINAIKGTALESMNIKDIFKNMSKYSMAVRNNGGGYFNHAFYWENIQPKNKILPSGTLLAAINSNFKTFDEFKKQFSEAGKTLFGSGWAWLCVDNKGKLFICSTPNQDNPLMDVAEKRGIPIFNMDVWEHAYYLKYQNKRADYIEAFWNIINWEEVGIRYENALIELSIK